MAISTTRSHIESAIDIQKRYNSAYLVLAKTTAWADESNPPNESEDLTDLTEVIGYKKVKRFNLARPLRAGETAETVGFPVVNYASQSWALIPVDQAYAQGARWLYIEADIQPTDFPLGSYRQVGVHLNLVPKTGVTKQNLLPSEVQDKGILKFYENRELTTRTASVYALEQFMVKV